MKCPKCEEGIIRKIVFKKGNSNGFLCEFCGAVWEEEEDIAENTGHPILSFTKDDDMAYTFVDAEDRDEDTSVMYPKFK